MKIVGGTVIQSLKSGKTQKVASLPRRGRKNLGIYSWYFLPDLKLREKGFICIPSVNFLEMRPLGTFGQFYQTVTMETMTVTKILTSVLAMYSKVL